MERRKIRGLPKKKDSRPGERLSFPFPVLFDGLSLRIADEEQHIQRRCEVYAGQEQECRAEAVFLSDRTDDDRCEAAHGTARIEDEFCAVERASVV